MDNSKIITNIEGLRNPTILQQLEALRQYVIENAIKGDTGPIGIYTTTVPYVNTTTQYPITLIKGYTPTSDNAELIGRIIYFASDGKTAIINGVGVSSLSSAPVYSVSNVKDIRGPQGLTGNGITAIVSGASYVEGNETITPITVTYSDATTQDLDIHSKNGSDGGITIDTALSTTSTNPVTNQAIATALNRANANINNRMLYRHYFYFPTKYGNKALTVVAPIEYKINSSLTVNEVIEAFAHAISFTVRYFDGGLILPVAGLYIGSSMKILVKNFTGSSFTDDIYTIPIEDFIDEEIEEIGIISE